jgi:glycosyltransferase involved in cell wall biosynthesis
MSEVRRIAAFVPNVLDKTPGQRVRIETWARYLGDYGWAVDFYPFEDARLDAVLYRDGHVAQKAARMLVCYVRQLRTVLSRPKCDVVLIYREAALVGPAIIERLAKRIGVPVVYDIDDPIFINTRSPVSGAFSRLKFSNKTDKILAMSDHVIAINDLLAGYARKHNDNVSIVPNMLDPERFKPADRREDDIVRIGWSGSHSTMPNLHAIAGPLRRIQAEHGTPMRIVGSGDLHIDGLDLDVRQWTPQTEVSDLQQCDIGILPVLDWPENRWKFFLKLVQYLAVGLPVVAQRAGSNADVIEDGVNGFVVDSEAEWHDRLALLVTDKALRRRMGRAARQTAVEHYSPAVQMPRVAAIFDRLVRPKP